MSREAMVRTAYLGVRSTSELSPWEKNESYRLMNE